MKELLTMWKNGQMVAITIVIAALYMTALIPFSEMTIIPGFTTVRPANVLPVVFSLLVGPAAAWGAAIGNLLSDAFSGQLTQGSLFGFVGNFFFGFVGYKLWGNLGPLSSGEEPTMRSGRQLLEYLVIAFVAAAGTGAIIGWGLDLLGLFPFSVFATIITINDFLVAAVLGPPLLYFLYPRIAAGGFRYSDIMHVNDLPNRPASHRRGAAVGIAMVAIVWVVLGIAIGTIVEGVPFAVVSTNVVPGTGGSTLEIVLGAVAFLLLCGLSAISGERLSSLCRE